MTRAKMMEMSKRVDELTAKYPVGTPCRYWTGAREGEGKQGTIRSAWAILGGHTVVVWIEGCSGCVAETHVEVRP